MSSDKVVTAWRSYDAWLATASEILHADLAAPAGEVDLDAYSADIKQPVPIELQQLWRTCGGQVTIDEGVGVLPGFDFLGPQAAAREWLVWERVRTQPSADEFAKLSASAESTPPDAIKRTYSSPGWMPVWREEMVANYIGLDMDPGPSGSAGQVINFGRDQDSKLVLATSLAALLEFVISEVESGRVVAATDSGAEFLKHVEGAFIEVVKANALYNGPLR